MTINLTIIHVVYQTLHVHLRFVPSKRLYKSLQSELVPLFNVKREQEITKEEVAMHFLHLFAKGVQVLNAGPPFHLEGCHFAKIVCLGGDWFLDDCAI